MDPATRLDDLEAKLSLAEDLLDTLNMTVFRQQEQIQALQRQLGQLAGQVAGMGAPDPHARPMDEVPPHY